MADSLYGSDDNYEDAKEMGIDVISPVKKSSEKGTINLKDFTFSEDGHVQNCPKGHKPVLKKKRNQIYTGLFYSNLLSMYIDRSMHRPAWQKIPLSRL